MKLLVLFLVVLNSIAAENKIISIDEAKEWFTPLPEVQIDSNSEVVKLGRRLYFEKGLSINNSISCNSCHRLDKFGADGKSTSPGHEKKNGERNSPTTLNAYLHNAQFWDGRAKDVEEQALGPILNPVEMGMPNQDSVLKKLEKLGYKSQFEKAFGKSEKSLAFDNIGKAIGAFERTLNTPSRFDEYLKGDESALTNQEKRGMKKFIHKGCVSCHNGPLLGGNSYQLLGAANEYNTTDLGRYNVTKDEDDKKVFKVPSLRNIHETAPYFHDGSVKTLDEAIKLMAYHQLDEKVGPGFIVDVKAFLKSLTTNKVFDSSSDSL